jgi:hypothetical protein
MTKVWEYTKAAINVYVDFIEDWPGAVAIFWPVSLVIAAVYF